MPDPVPPKDVVREIATTHNELASSLISFAKENALLAKGDWVQGGWSRAAERVEFGYSPEAAVTRGGGPGG